VLGANQRLVVDALKTLGLLAAAARAAPLLEQATRIGQTGLDQIAFEQLVDDMVLQRFRCTDGLAADDHLQRLLDTGQSGQALGTTGAGQQAQFHLRQADLGILSGDAVMTTQRNFQPATECGAVDHRDARLVAAFDGLDHLRQARCLRRFAELLDVGAGHEGRACADQHHGRHLGRRVRLFKGIQQAFSYGMAKRVDRRVIDQNQSDIAPAFEPNDIRHAGLPFCEMLIGIVISRNHVSHCRINDSFPCVDSTARPGHSGEKKAQHRATQGLAGNPEATGGRYQCREYRTRSRLAADGVARGAGQKIGVDAQQTYRTFAGQRGRFGALGQLGQQPRDVEHQRFAAQHTGTQGVVGADHLTQLQGQRPLRPQCRAEAGRTLTQAALQLRLIQRAAAVEPFLQGCAGAPARRCSAAIRR